MSNSNSNRSQLGQAETIAIAIAEPGSVLNVAMEEADKDRILRQIAAGLKAALWRGIDRHYPELRSTAKRHPGNKLMASHMGLDEFFVSMVLNEKRRDFRVSTLVKFAEWVGEPIDQVLGL